MQFFRGFNALANTQKSPYWLMLMLKILTLFDPWHSRYRPISRFLRFPINVLHSPRLPLLHFWWEPERENSLLSNYATYQLRLFSMSVLRKYFCFKFMQAICIYHSCLQIVKDGKYMLEKKKKIVGGPHTQGCSPVCVLLQERLWTTSDLGRAGGSHPGYKGGGANICPA